VKKFCHFLYILYSEKHRPTPLPTLYIFDIAKTKMSESDKAVVEENQIGVSSDTIYIKNAM